MKEYSVEFFALQITFKSIITNYGVAITHLKPKLRL